MFLFRQVSIGLRLGGGAILVVLLLLGTPQSFGDEANKKRFQMLKALPLYLEWPDGKKPREMRICIVSDENPFKALIAALPPQRIGGARLRIFHTEKIAPLPPAEIYYFDLESEALATRLARALKGKPVVRVSSIKEFSNRGGDIHFYDTPTKVHLEVNRTVLKQQGIKPRSQLLRLSRPEKPR